jgi:hypothetical protein
MYARIIDNKHIEYCPQELLIEAQRVIGFTEEFLNKHGYYKLILTECNINKNQSISYEFRNNTIIQICE